MKFLFFLQLLFLLPASGAESVGELIGSLRPHYKAYYREKAKTQLVKIGSRALPELYSAYKDSADESTRMSILGVMGEIGDGSASSWIVSRLDPGDPVALHGKMIETLGRLKSRGSAAPLIANIRKVQQEVFFPQDQETILAVTFWALGEIGDPAAEPLLEKAVKHFKTGNPMLCAINAMGRLKSERSGDFLRGLLLYEEPSVRFAAANCLKARGEALSLPVLWAAFEAEKNPEVAQALAQAIAAIGRSGAASRFSEIFYSGPDEWSKNLAVAGLKAVGRKSVPYILNGMRSAGWKAKIDAIKLLGELGGGEAAEALAGLSRNNDRDIQIAALAAMGGVDDPAAKKALESALQSEDETISFVAASSIERMEGPR